MTKTIVCCSEAADGDWKWIAPEVDEADFHFVSCAPRNSLERHPLFNIARFRGSFEAVRLSKRIGADLLVAHGPTLTAWCALFGRWLTMRAKVTSFAFNFSVTPNRLKTWVFSRALRTVDRFFVFSNVERQLYARLFSLPEQKFEFIHWGVHPSAPNTTPSGSGDYVCAIGGNARDYFTLIEAARLLPDIPFMLVVRPENVRGIKLPSNVAVQINIPYSVCMGILYQSRFMVLPLINAEIPCGHVTIVAAMHLGKAMVVTSSSGVADYVTDNENAITVPPNDVNAMASAIRRLWQDRELCLHLGNEGKMRATKLYNESSVVDHFRNYLRSLA